MDGFENGFSLGYRNDQKVKITAHNLRLRVGNEIDLWNKVMKEVKLKRYARPFEQIPYKNDFIQSPIGLVPKDNGKDTRLIFHLSHPRCKNGQSGKTPIPQPSSAKYNIQIFLLQSDAVWRRGNHAVFLNRTRGQHFAP